MSEAMPDGVESLGEQLFRREIEGRGNRLLNMARRCHQSGADRLRRHVVLLRDPAEGSAPQAKLVTNPSPPDGGIFWDV
jgi:hypothetical protein